MSQGGKLGVKVSVPGPPRSREAEGGGWRWQAGRAWVSPRWRD